MSSLLWKTWWGGWSCQVMIVYLLIYFRNFQAFQSDFTLHTPHTLTLRLRVSSCHRALSLGLFKVFWQLYSAVFSMYVSLVASDAIYSPVPFMYVLMKNPFLVFIPFLITVFELWGLYYHAKWMSFVRHMDPSVFCLSVSWHSTLWAGLSNSDVFLLLWFTLGL